MVVELKPHQRAILNNISDGKVLVGGVGSGKTITALVYFYEKVMGGTLGDFTVPHPMDLYVFTTARKRDSQDWQDWAVLLGISTDREASATGVRLVVDSYNNIQKYKEIKNAYIILDEQRMVGSGAWTKTFLKLAKSNRWLMLSATPGDKWEDYIPLFVANGFYRTRSEFKREHCVYSYYGRYPKLERYLGVGRLVRLRNSILVKMPYERHTIRHICRTPVSFDEALYERVVKKRWHVYENRPLKDAAELFSVMRKVVNSDKSRLSTLLQLMEKHPRLIVFYNFDYELEILRSLAQEKTPTSASQKDVTGKLVSNSEDCGIWAKDYVPSADGPDPRKSIQAKKAKYEFDKWCKRNPPDPTIFKKGSELVVAEWNGHKHEPVPTSERWVYLVQYTAGAEAWNCTETDAIAFYSLNYSYRLFEQAQGRIDRLDTPFTDLWYYVLASKSVIDTAILKAVLKKENFNEQKSGLAVGFGK